MMETLRANGVVRGFNAQAQGATLLIGPGLAYCDGQRVSGGWELDYSAREDGWCFAGVGSLPMYAVLVAKGTVAAIRDVRRFAALAVCSEAGVISLSLGCPSVIHRIVTAARVQSPQGALAWKPLPGGHAQASLSDEDLALSVRSDTGRTVAVLVEYTHTGDRHANP